MRIGHEWCGTVSAVGQGVDPVLDRPAHHGRHHAGLRALPALPVWVCSMSARTGSRSGSGAASREHSPNSWPCRPRHCMPCRTRSTSIAGALVEPGGNALRAVRGADLTPGDRLLVLGPGTIGLLVALFARAMGAEVHLMGQTAWSLDFARSLGFDGVWTADEPAGHGLGRSGRLVQLRRPARSRPRPGGAGQTGCLHRAFGHSECRRHPADRPQGCDRGRDPQCLTGSGGRYRATTHRPRSTHGRWSLRRSASTRRVRC